MDIMDIPGRNEEIWRKRTEEGWTLRELAKMYGLSPERIRQIVITANRIYNPLNQRGQTLRDHFIREFSPMVEDRGQCAMSIKGIFNVLMRGRPSEISDWQPKDFLDWFVHCTDEDFACIRGLGVERIAIVKDIQKAMQSTDGLREKLLNGCTKIVDW